MKELKKRLSRGGSEYPLINPARRKNDLTVLKSRAIASITADLTSTHRERKQRSSRRLITTSQPSDSMSNSLLAQVSVESTSPESPPEAIEYHGVDNPRKQECPSKTNSSSGVAGMKRVHSSTWHSLATKKSLKSHRPVPANLLDSNYFT